MIKRLIWGIGLLCLCLVSFSSSPPSSPVKWFVYAGDPIAAQGDAQCRFGVGQVKRPITEYAVGDLDLGWYLDWRTSLAPPQPNEIEYVQMLRVNVNGYAPSGTTLENIIAAQPGAVWLVGNEPDCVYQDNLLPEQYAQVYHDAYQFIKSRDPAAQIVVGNIVQPTALRMQYLDRVLDSYMTTYGGPLPADAWGIHSFILREASCQVYEHCWGAEIPPGIAASVGEWYDAEDTDRLDIFQSRLWQFRQWMYDRGYRDTPLWITEYGTLFPHDFEGWGMDRARVFMYGTFDFLSSVSDAKIGYSADEGRLVQRWLWYSLDDDAYGGILFDRYTTLVTQLGQDFADYTGALPATLDLLAVPGQVGQRGMPPLSTGEGVTVTLEAQVSNVGSKGVPTAVIVRFLDDQDAQIGSDQIIPAGLGGCASVASVSVDWPNLPPGTHAFQIVVDPLNAVIESSESNNEQWGIVVVATDRVFLPSIAREAK